MKKKLVIFLFGVIVSLIFFSCENGPGDENRKRASYLQEAIRFKIGLAPQVNLSGNSTPDNNSMISTKAATDEAFNSTWESGDEIGIFAVCRPKVATEAELMLKPSGNYIHNKRLTYSGESGGGWQLDEGVELFYPTADYVLDFYAYYPYLEDPLLNPGFIVFNVMTDQAGVTETDGAYRSNYNLSDLLWAKSDNNGDGYATGDVIELLFSHALSLVQVDISQKEINVPMYDPESMRVVLKGVNTGAVMDLGNISVTAGNGGTGDVVMQRVEELSDISKYSYRALIPAQNINAGHVLFNFIQDCDGDGDYAGYSDFFFYYTENSTVSLFTGYVSKYDVKLTWGDIDPSYRYALGDLYPHVGKPVGIVYALNDARDDGLGMRGSSGKIVSLDEALLQWCLESITVGGTNRNSGKTNQTAIRQYIANTNKPWSYLPVFEWVERKNQGRDFWYIPADKELSTLYSAYSGNTVDLNGSIAGVGGMPISGHIYWSSTETGGSNNARTIDFLNNNSGVYDKIDTFNVRAIADF